MSLNKLIVDRFGLPTETGKTVSLNETLTTILNHRSCRDFADDPVSDDLMKTLLAAAFSAPSKSDLQQVSVIRIIDDEIKKTIAELNELQYWIADAPEFLVWCGDNRRLRELCKARGHDFANDHLDSFMNPAVDAGIAMQTFNIAAASVKLGCCPVSSIRNNIRELSELLQIPKYVFPIAGLTVGYPAETPSLSMRLPLELTVHNNRYKTADLLSLVDSYDASREQQNPTTAPNQRRPDLFGTKKIYSWSEDKTRQYALVERGDWGKYIRNQGFRLE